MSCLSIYCLSFQHLFRLYPFWRMFSLHLWRLCPLLRRFPQRSGEGDKKKSVCNALLFAGNLGPVVPMVCGNHLAWRELLTNLRELKSRFWFWEQRYTICVYTVPFYITLSHFTQCYTVCAYAVYSTLPWAFLTQRYTFCVLYCKWVLGYS